MERTAVASSNVASVGYRDRVLEVAFKSGGVYRYFDVPPEVHQHLVTAPSVGKVMAAIAGAGFRFEKVGPQA